MQAIEEIVKMLKEMGFTHGRWSQPGNEMLDHDILVDGKVVGSLRVAFSSNIGSVIVFCGKAGYGPVKWSATFSHNTPFAVIKNIIDAGLIWS